MGALIAGPFCAKLLGEFGADVVKLEPPGQGDPLRKWRYLKDGTSVWWHVQSRNKRSVSVDLRKPEGQAIARELALRADIVVENFRPGTLEAWGLGYEALAAHNPGLVMVRISGYGQDGPYAQRPGFGVIGEAMGGLRYVTGTPDRPPSRTGVSIGDTLAALYGVIGALMAIEARHRSGRGQVVDVALYEAVFSVMESMLPEFERVRRRARAHRLDPARHRAHVGLSLRGRQPRADRRQRRLDLPPPARWRWAATTSPATRRSPHNEGRGARQAWLDGEIEAWTVAPARRRRSSATLARAEVPRSRIYTVRDIVDDAQYRARDMIRETATLADGCSVQGARRGAEAFRDARRLRRRRTRGWASTRTRCCASWATTRRGSPRYAPPASSEGNASQRTRLVLRRCQDALASARRRGRAGERHGAGQRREQREGDVARRHPRHRRQPRFDALHQ